jgi:hypothetical protein
MAVGLSLGPHPMKSSRSAVLEWLSEPGREDVASISPSRSCRKPFLQLASAMAAQRLDDQRFEHHPVR